MNLKVDMKLGTSRYTSKLRRAGFFALVSLLIAATASAQDEKVTLNRGQVTVGQMIKSIQDQTRYVFAFDSRTFDFTRRITVENPVYSLREAVELMVDGTGFSYMINESYVVINSRAKKTEQPFDGTFSRTGDVYRPNKLGEADRNYLPRSVKNVEPKPAEPESFPVISTDIQPEAYSSYINPDLYAPMSGKLPRVSLKANLLYGGAAFAPNLGVEIGTSPWNTLEIWGSYNGWEHGNNDTKQLQHFIVRPEFRWWTFERYSGHFMGVNAMYAKYQISGKKVPMLFKKGNRYDGYAVGVGFTYGYQLALGKKWGLEFNVGVGAAYMHYDKFTCAACDRDAEKKDKWYVGPTRAGVSLVFLIK